MSKRTHDDVLPFVGDPVEPVQLERVGVGRPGEEDDSHKFHWICNFSQVGEEQFVSYEVSYSKNSDL